MRAWIVAACVLGCLGSAAADGRVTIELGDARLVTWSQGYSSWLEVNGVAKVHNGLPVPITSIVIHAQLFHRFTVTAKPGEVTPTGSGSQAQTLATPLGPGESRDLTLKIKVDRGGLGNDQSVELSAKQIGTSPGKTRVLPADGAPSPNGISARLVAPAELESWLVAENVDAKVAEPIRWLARVQGSFSAVIKNDGSQSVDRVELVREGAAPDERAGAAIFPVDLLLDGESAVQQLSLGFDLPLADASAKPPTELPLPLAVRSEVTVVHPAPTQVAKAVVLKTALNKGKSAGKVKKGEFVVELRRFDESVYVRTAAGVRGWMPDKALEMPLKMASKKLKGASYRQTADGRYIALCWTARDALGIRENDYDQVLSKGERQLKFSLRKHAAIAKNGTTETAVTLDPPPFRTGRQRCTTIHERQLAEHLGVTIE